MFSPTAIIVFLVIFAMHVTLFVIGGIILFIHRKEQHDRTRIILGSFMLLMGVAIMAFIAEGLLIRGGMEEFFRKSLPAYPVISFYFVWILLPFYLIEMLRPYLLTLRRIIRSLSPASAVFLAFIVWHATEGFGDYTPIYNFHDIFNNISNIDVVFRLVLIAVFILSGFNLFFIPKDWRRSNAPQPHFNVMVALVFTFIFTFIFGMIMRIPVCIVLHYIVLDAICGIALYMEFFVRIPVPEKIAQESIAIADAVCDATAFPPFVIQRLQHFIDGDLWKNPDIQQTDLCTAVSTNRTYLLAAIRALGYANYSDMLNKIRVKYVHDALGKNPEAHLLDLYFDAGFRSRNTASRAFFQLYGCLPSLYQKQLQTKIDSPSRD